MFYHYIILFVIFLGGRHLPICIPNGQWNIIIYNLNIFKCIDWIKRLVCYQVYKLSEKNLYFVWQIKVKHS